VLDGLRHRLRRQRLHPAQAQLAPLLSPRAERRRARSRGTATHRGARSGSRARARGSL
jgi:hypothetical protein